jgi:hypothetical protein
VRRIGEKLALNPGSVCGPLNGYVGGQYALLDWGGARWQAELRTVTYDLEPVREACITSGLFQAAPVFTKGILLCEHTGQDVIMDFLRYAFALARENGSTLPYVPDDLWQQAAESFDWARWEAIAGITIPLPDIPAV